MTFLEIMKIDAYHIAWRPLPGPPNAMDTSDKPHVLTSELEPLTKPVAGSSEPRYFKRF